jgi:hypothetical protein
MEIFLGSLISTLNADGARKYESLLRVISSLRDNTSSMSASGGKAAVQRLDFEQSISSPRNVVVNVCFHRKRSLRYSKTT